MNGPSGSKIGKYSTSGAVSGNTCQNGAHVGIANIDSALEGDRAAQFLEATSKYLLELISVGAAIVNGSSCGGAQFVVGEFSRNGTLEQVGMANAEVARLPGLTLEGQSRGSVGR